MPTVLLGNLAVVESFGEAQAVVHSGDEAPPAPANTAARPDLGQQITVLSPADAPVEAQVQGIAAAYVTESSVDPAWVECDDPVLAEAVAAFYGCPIGCPVTHDEWKEG